MTMNSIKRWRQAQGADIGPDQMDAEVKLGPILSDSWLRDPKHVGFVLARYKFVAKMLTAVDAVAEVGAGDGWAAQIVAQEVGYVHTYDIAPLRAGIRPYDVMGGMLPTRYDAIYALDIFEHIKSGEVFFYNLSDSLRSHGTLIVGTPSRESQTYASEPSRKLHINCMSGDSLRELALRYFHHVFMFSMNDEVVHTGFMPMAHYLFAVCAEPK
jgi:hypothetical protein